MLLLQERELGELLTDIARRIFGNLGQLVALLIVFGLPLVESVRRSRREAREKARGGAPRPRPARSAPGPSPSPRSEQREREAHGREVWEALLRGERPPEPPPTPVRPAPVTRVPAHERPLSPVPGPLPSATLPTGTVDEEALAHAVLERDLARGRAMSEAGAPLASLAPPVASALAGLGGSLALAPSRVVRAPRTARELVLASEVLAGPVALRAPDSGGSLPPGLSAW